MWVLRGLVGGIWENASNFDVTDSLKSFVITSLLIDSFDVSDYW